MISCLSGYCRVDILERFLWTMIISLCYCRVLLLHFHQTEKWYVVSLGKNL